MSLRHEREWDEAFLRCVDVIDLKEPRLGALAAVPIATLQRVRKLLNGRLPLSLALGELTDYLDSPSIGRDELAEQVDFVKLGMAGSLQLSDWRRDWETVVRRFPESVKPVAVAYADYRTCQAPDPESVLQQGVALGLKHFLLDTHVKSGGPSWAHLEASRIVELIVAAREQEMHFALAGSLQRDDLPTVVRWCPDMVAIRSAATRGRREDPVDIRHVRLFREALSAAVAEPAHETVAEPAHETVAESDHGTSAACG